MASILYSVFFTVLFQHFGLKSKFAEYDAELQPNESQGTMAESDEQGHLMDEDKQENQSLIK